MQQQSSKSWSHLPRQLSQLLLVLLLAGSSQLPGLVHAQDPPAAGPDLSQIPEACINGGTDLQTKCSETLTAAQTYFGVQVGLNGEPAPATQEITQEQIDAYVAQAPAPTPECCKAACDFNANFCSCEKGVLDFAVQLTANDPNGYKSVARGFAEACQFKLYYGDTCPPKDQRAAITPTDLQTCAALPPPIPAGQAERATAAAAANAISSPDATATNTTLAPANATVAAAAGNAGSVPLPAALPGNASGR